MNTRARSVVAAACLLMVALMPGQQAGAQPRHDGGRIEHREPGAHFDRLPPRSHEIRVNRDRYYYRGGIFYSPRNRGYEVIRAPIGAYVEVLPRGHSRIRVGVNLFYVYNDTYYRWNPAVRQYVVVEEPAGANQAEVIDVDDSDAAEAATGDFIFYPKRGQSEEQLGRDRYECHLWAYKQSGFDPSLADPDQEGSKSDYRRAITACMEGRDYVVK